MNNQVCCVCQSPDYTVLFPGRGLDRDLTPEHIAARKGSINTAYRHNWVRCRHCGLVYVTPPPREDVLAALYTESDQSGYDREVGHLVYTYGRYLAQYQSWIVKRSLALDIGAGNGFFLATLKQFGFAKVIGIEPSTTACKAATEDIRPLLINRMFSAKDFAPGSVDFTSCFQTLEHCYRPDLFVEELAAVLSEGGIVFCVCHDAGALGVKLLGARHPIVNAGHLTLFNRKTLTMLFSSRFDVLAVFPIRNRYSLSYWISLLPIGDAQKCCLTRPAARLHLETKTLDLNLGNMGLIARRKVRE
ncbi:MAG: class I SAM-dependent methyltransferase [Kiritimatiellae bacterium]|nr:class I SAM-dependent methyltransferase [Kiritimatiellia bacterium]